jgi:oxygen-independent coproporphyrinogen-3 oxidase
MFEFFFLGLRKIQGVMLSDFRDEFGVSVDDVYSHLLEILSDQGLIERTKARIFLTARGLMLADTVIGNFSEIEKEVPAPKVPAPWVTRPDRV